MPGVIEANVNLAIERADVRAVPGVTRLADLVDAVTKAGYGARIESPAASQAQAEEEHRQREQAQLRREFTLLLISAAFATPLLLQMVAMWLGLHWHLPAWVRTAARHAGAVRHRRTLLPLSLEGA